MAKRRRGGEREAFWQAAVRRHQSSGQSVRAFCLAEHLSEASFYAWRRTLREREAATPPSFVPLLLASPPTKTPLTGQTSL
jgi:transposase-like protein